MRKITCKPLRTVLLCAAVLAMLFFPAMRAEASPTDEIQDFTIQVDVNEDASLNMTYHVEWKVLYDGGGSEKLTWVNLGVPNSFHENIQPLSDTVKNIVDKGSTLEIYLDRGYGKDETVAFDFSMTQDHMYQIDKWTEGETVYTFTPAWFDDFDVDRLTIRWNADMAGAWQPDCQQEEGYLVFSTALPAGSRYTMSVTYPNSAFGFSEDRQESGGGSQGNGGYNYKKSTGETIMETIGTIVGVIMVIGLFFVLPIFLFVKFVKWIASGFGFGPNQNTEKKITRTKIEYYESCPSCGASRKEGEDNCPYCGRSMIKSK